LRCEECGGMIISPEGGYHVCEDCGLCVERKYEGNSVNPLTTCGGIRGEYRTNQGLFVSDYNKLYYMKKLYSFNASDKKIRNYKLLEEYLNLLDLTAERRYKIKDLFISNNNVETYKEMMKFAIETMLKMNYPLTTEEMLEAIPKFSSNKNAIIKEIGKPVRDYKWLIYRIFNNLKNECGDMTHKQMMHFYKMFLEKNEKFINISEISVLYEKLIEFMSKNFKKIKMDYEILWKCSTFDI
jgi:hypothetical protein